LKAKQMNNEHNFNDDGGITLTSDFAYDELDAALGYEPTELDIEGALECMRRVWRWVYQTPCTDLDGFMCRCIVACWVFVPELRAETMTHIAGRFGKKKQSLGRWVVNFQKTFPEITKHLQHQKHFTDK